MKRLTVLMMLAIAGCGAPARGPAAPDDLGALLNDGPADPSAQETAVTDADPAGQLGVWAKVVLDPADPATVQRLKSESQAQLQRLDEELQEARAHWPYVSIDQRQGLLRRIAYETERLRLIEAKAGR